MRGRKKAVLQDLEQLIKSLASFAILLVVVALVVSQIKANGTVSADSNATYAVTQVQESMSTIPSWLKIITITVVGGVLLMLVNFFRGRA